MGARADGFDLDEQWSYGELMSKIGQAVTEHGRDMQRAAEQRLTQASGSVEPAGGHH